jgi:hypothetical protein
MLCAGASRSVGDLPGEERKLVGPNLFGSKPFLKNSYELQVIVLGADPKKE